MSREVVSNLPEESANLLADLPKDENTRNSMIKLVTDRNLMGAIIEFQNEVNVKIRSANPAGLDVEKLRDAYKRKDIAAATTILGLSQQDLQVLQQKQERLYNRLRIIYPEIYSYAKSQASPKTSDCPSCAAEAALGDVHRVSNAIQASYILQSKKFKGRPDIVYPSISVNEDPGGGGPGGPAYNNDCTFEQASLALLRCQLIATGCTIGAAFTPPPFDLVLLSICLIDWVYCTTNAQQCK